MFNSKPAAAHEDEKIAAPTNDLANLETACKEAHKVLINAHVVLIEVEKANCSCHHKAAIATREKALHAYTSARAALKNAQRPHLLAKIEAMRASKTNTSLYDPYFNQVWECSPQDTPQVFSLAMEQYTEVYGFRALKYAMLTDPRSVWNKAINQQFMPILEAIVDYFNLTPAKILSSKLYDIKRLEGSYKLVEWFNNKFNIKPLEAQYTELLKRANFNDAYAINRFKIQHGKDNIKSSTRTTALGPNVSQPDHAVKLIMDYAGLKPETTQGAYILKVDDVKAGEQKIVALCPKTHDNLVGRLLSLIARDNSIEHRPYARVETNRIDGKLRIQLHNIPGVFEIDRSDISEKELRKHRIGEKPNLEIKSLGKTFTIMPLEY